MILPAKPGLVVLALCLLVGCSGGPDPFDDVASATRDVADVPQATLPAGRQPGPEGCRGGWADAESYGNLVGQWVRARAFEAGPGELIAVRIETQAALDPVREGGRYQRWARASSGSLPYDTARGTYLALVANPAIGAVLSFRDDGRPEDEAIGYSVIGIRRSITGEAKELCVAPMQGPSTRAFVLQRWTP